MKDWISIKINLGQIKGQKAQCYHGNEARISTFGSGGRDRLLLENKIRIYINFVGSGV